jgi:diphosphomevalonate decarboxylase
MGLLIESENNFRTAAGLASSSSGLSCLAVCLATVYGLSEEFEGQFSTFARLGSGSACRSLYGGFVEWERGYTNEEEVRDPAVSDRSIAKPWFKDEPETLEYWCDNLRLLICVAKPDEGQSTVKEVPSTEGMQLTLMTSELLKLKLAADLPNLHIKQLAKALRSRDFKTFCEIVTQESNQLHAVCLDTYPAIFYMNSTSKSIALKIQQLNKKRTVAAYSCDAGFHVFVFVLKDDLKMVRDAIESDNTIRLEQVIETSIDRHGVEIIH